MNRSNSALSVVEEPTRLESARAVLDEITRQLDALHVQIADVEAGAAPAAAAAGAAASLRQQKTGMFARMLKLGKVDTAAPEVRAIDKQLADAETVERQSAAVVAARGEVIAELQAQVAELSARLPAARRELALAQFEEAGQDIRNELLPAFRAACAALGSSYARLVGAGSAHSQLARVLREQHGVTGQALGIEFPATSINIAVVGFGLDGNDGFNNLRVDVRAEIDAAAAEALKRWRR
jgi:hypothetical protein